MRKFCCVWVCMLLAAHIGPLMIAQGGQDMSERHIGPVQSAQLLRPSASGPFVLLTGDGDALLAQVSNGYQFGTRLRFGPPETLIGPTGAAIASGTPEGFAATPGRSGEVYLFWGEHGRTFASHATLDDAARWSEPESIGPGTPSAALTDGAGQPCVAGILGDEEDRTVWFARLSGAEWQRAVVASGPGYEAPQMAISHLGVLHIVWRDADGCLWHLKSNDGQLWLRCGNTSRSPERIGHAAGDPTVACTRAQVVVAYASAQGSIEYSHFTGQNWDTNLPVTTVDTRFAEDDCADPRFAIAGDGVPWLFFVNRTRRFCYYTRWLGFGFSTITVAGKLFDRSEDFSTYLAAIERAAPERRAWPGSESLGLALASSALPDRVRAETLSTPVLVGRPGEDHLLVDDLELVRALWVEQHMPGPVKDPANPVITHGPEGSFDDQRAFNMGTVIKDGDIFRMWYGAMNPKSPYWDTDWTKIPRTGYAESRDGVHWTKPILNLAEWNGSTANNMLPDFGIVPFVMLNPDQSDPQRKFLAFHTGDQHYSADGLRWTPDPDVTVAWPSGKPQWFENLSVLYDPRERNPQMRWKMYGCFAPKDPQRTIGLAYSPDGRHWTVHPDNPIVSPLSGPYLMAHDVSVVRHGAHYLAVYQAGAGYSIGLALMASRDGINWTPVCEGKPFIEHGAGDAWDRGLLLPSVPVTVGDEVFIYYGGANYQAPGEEPFDYERWKHCYVGGGLARLPLNRWAGFRNTAGDGRSIGYIETGPIRTEDIRDCVLSVNVDGCDAGHYLLAEILHGETDERVPGYEHENSDEMHESGLAQVMSWRGGASLNGIPTGATVRIRFILRGIGAPVLYSWSLQRDPEAIAPPLPEAAEDVTEKPMVYRSTVSDLSPLKAWIAYKPNGTPKPIIVVMHGYGDPVLRHGGRRVANAVRGYARQGLFAIGVDLRGREESAGLRDDGGLEIMDIYDAVQSAVEQYPTETDPDNVNIVGSSGGGGNVFSAVVRCPDLFSNAAAFYGIPDYEYAARTAWQSVIPLNVGGTPAQVPDRYFARNSTRGVVNLKHTEFHFYWDEKEFICPAAMDEEFRREAARLGYENIHPHESRATDTIRWLHEGAPPEASQEFERTFMPLVLNRNNPDPRIDEHGRLMVLGFLMTKRFQALFGQGNDAVVRLRYALEPNEYRFQFRLQTSDPTVRGWLRIMDRAPEELLELLEDDQPRSFDVDEAGRILLRDVLPNGRYRLRFR